MNDATKKEEVTPPESEKDKEKACCSEHDKLYVLLCSLLGRL